MKFYVTFKMSSPHPHSFFTLNEMRDMIHARLEASKLFGDEVLMVWSESQWVNYLGHTMDKRFNLKEIGENVWRK